MIPEKYQKQIEAEANERSKTLCRRFEVEIDQNAKQTFIDGVEYVWPIAQSNGEEIGEARMAKRMIDQMKSEGVRADFVEHIEKIFADVLKKAEWRE